MARFDNFEIDSQKMPNLAIEFRSFFYIAPSTESNATHKIGSMRISNLFAASIISLSDKKIHLIYGSATDFLEFLNFHL